MIQLGLLWFDDDPKRPLGQKITLAVERYRERLGRKPEVCQLNPAQAVQAAALASQKHKLNGPALPRVRLVPDPTLRPNYFLVGTEDEAAAVEPAWAAALAESREHNAAATPAPRRTTHPAHDKPRRRSDLASAEKPRVAVAAAPPTTAARSTSVAVAAPARAGTVASKQQSVEPVPASEPKTKPKSQKKAKPKSKPKSKPETHKPARVRRAQPNPVAKPAPVAPPRATAASAAPVRIRRARRSTAPSVPAATTIPSAPVPRARAVSQSAKKPRQRGMLTVVQAQLPLLADPAPALPPPAQRAPRPPRTRQRGAPAVPPVTPAPASAPAAASSAAPLRSRRRMKVSPVNDTTPAQPSTSKTQQPLTRRHRRAS